MHVHQSRSAPGQAGEDGRCHAPRGFPQQQSACPWIPLPSINVVPCLPTPPPRSPIKCPRVAGEDRPTALPARSF
jgi:hypothetical protein